MVDSKLAPYARSFCACAGRDAAASRLWERDANIPWPEVLPIPVRGSDRRDSERKQQQRRGSRQDTYYLLLFLGGFLPSRGGKLFR